MANYVNPTLSGKVIAVGEVKTFASGFSVRELVIDNGGNWPNPIPVRFAKERTALLDNVKPDDHITIQYRLSGREYNGRYYSDVQGLAIVGGDAPAKSASGEPTTAEVEAAFADDDPDNIPF